MSETGAQNQNAIALGVRLKEARESLGLTVDDISQSMKVSNSIVLAMEQGLHERLGAPVYVRGFLRSFAKRVQMDAALAEMIDGMQGVEELPLVAATGPRQGTPVGERWMLATSYLVGTAILISAIVLVMQADRLIPKAKVLTDSPAPAVPVTAAPITVELPLVADSTLPNVASAIDAINPAAVPAQQSPAVPPQEMTAIAAAMTGLPQVGNPVNTALVSSGFDVIANNTSWLRVVDAEGKEVFGDNLSAGRTQNFNGSSHFDVLLGNAAGAELKIGGKAIDLSVFTRGNVAKLRINDVDGQLQAVPLPR